MMPQSLRFPQDWDSFVESPEFTTEIDGYTVEISKVGGGTVGNEYEGYRQHRVSRNGITADDEGDYLYTGLPHTHEWVAQFVVESLYGE